MVSAIKATIRLHICWLSYSDSSLFHASDETSIDQLPPSCNTIYHSFIQVALLAFAVNTEIESFITWYSLWTSHTGGHVPLQKVAASLPLYCHLYAGSCISPVATFARGGNTHTQQSSTLLDKCCVIYGFISNRLHSKDLFTVYKNINYVMWCVCKMN